MSWIDRKIQICLKLATGLATRKMVLKNQTFSGPYKDVLYFFQELLIKTELLKRLKTEADVFR